MDTVQRDPEPHIVTLPDRRREAAMPLSRRVCNHKVAVCSEKLEKGLRVDINTSSQSVVLALGGVHARVCRWLGACWYGWVYPYLSSRGRRSPVSAGYVSKRQVRQWWQPSRDRRNILVDGSVGRHTLTPAAPNIPAPRSSSYWRAGAPRQQGGEGRETTAGK
ncbi:hypothetical protein LX36DRAFT_674703 [Colletotrichum falcatum]|nr:hypothetical protein LX36DRAFT_674703 [Colletotrichum falcatum]